jgi:signal transduction histidine kinase
VTAKCLPPSASKKPVVLDTLTTRFLMLFILMLGIPLFSLIGFCYKLLEATPSLLQQFTMGALPLAFIALMLSVAIAFWAARSITQPVYALMHTVKQLRFNNNQGHQPLLEALLNVKGVSEIKQLANAFTHMLLRLKDEEQLRDDFTATLTHDLKVPLLAEKQTLCYFSQGIYGPTTPTQAEVLVALQSTNRDSLALVNGLLEVTRYSHGTVHLLQQRVDLPVMLNSVIQTLDALLQERHQCLSTNYLASGFVWADPLELKRVLTNLLSNAITNTPHYGQLHVAIYNFSQLPPGHTLTPSGQLQQLTSHDYTSLPEALTLQPQHVLLSIQDSGIGFSLQDIGQLFKQFSANKGRNPLSTGLGLYNAYQVLQSHGGQLWIESTEGLGSAVNCLLSQPPVPVIVETDRRSRTERRLVG